MCLERVVRAGVDAVDRERQRPDDVFSKAQERTVPLARECKGPHQKMVQPSKMVRTVLIRLGKDDHIGRQNLGNAADARADNKQAGRGGLDKRSPKRLGQRRVEKDLPASKGLPDGREDAKENRLETLAGFRKCSRSQEDAPKRRHPAERCRGARSGRAVCAARASVRARPSLARRRQ